jgi:hypothetical protein
MENPRLASLANGLSVVYIGLVLADSSTLMSMEA